MVQAMYGGFTDDKERRSGMGGIKVTRDADQDKVTIELPVQGAQLVKRAVQLLGLDLIIQEQFHANDRLSVAASTASINLANLFEAFTEAGVA
jgi:hypothetical protein